MDNLFQASMKSLALYALTSTESLAYLNLWSVYAEKSARMRFSKSLTLFSSPSSRKVLLPWCRSTFRSLLKYVLCSTSNGRSTNLGKVCHGENGSFIRLTLSQVMWAKEVKSSEPNLSWCCKNNLNVLHSDWTYH